MLRLKIDSHDIDSNGSMNGDEVHQGDKMKVQYLILFKEIDKS